jgi:hypothetical protein
VLTLVGLALLLVPAVPAGASDDVRARLAAVLDDEQRAHLAFLEHLGWRFVAVDGVEDVTVHGGRPGAYDTLDAARTAGALRVLVPRGAPEETLERLGSRLAALADAVPTRLAFQHRLAPAVKEATRRLSEASAADRYVFPQWLCINALLFSLSPPQPAWVEADGVWRPRDRPSSGIVAFYEQPAEAECYVGQWLAAYATQYELYGPERFDTVFDREEIVLGRPLMIKPTPIGRTTRNDLPLPWWALLLRPEDRREDPAVALARHGPMAFVGLTGIVRNQRERVYSNDNFMIVSVSPRANAILLEQGGLAYVRRRATEAREHHQRSLWWLAPDASGAEGRRCRDEVLADPVFEEIQVYVHPFGVVSLGFIVRRWISVRSPTEVVLYLHGREDAFFRRYRDAFVEAYRSAAE